MKKTPISLIIGGARSGKSQYAESLCENHEKKIYLATAQAHDEEFQQRIKVHQQRRENKWQTIEEPLDITNIITIYSRPETVVLIDCLTLWLSNLLEHEKDIEQETNALITALDQADGPVIMVSNEVGLSIVPENALARRFRDEQGKLNQALAKVATNVVFIAAGLPLILKQPED